MVRAWVWGLVLASGCSAPPPDPTAPDELTIVHEFPVQTVAPGQEQLGNCRSWTLANLEEVWVNSVEFSQDEGSHHANFIFIPDQVFAGPDGIWSCQDRNYDFY